MSDGIYRPATYHIQPSVALDGTPCFVLWSFREYMDWEGGIGEERKIVAANADRAVLELAVVRLQHATSGEPSHE